MLQFKHYLQIVETGVSVSPTTGATTWGLSFEKHLDLLWDDSFSFMEETKEWKFRIQSIKKIGKPV